MALLSNQKPQTVAPLNSANTVARHSPIGLYVIGLFIAVYEKVFITHKTALLPTYCTSNSPPPIVCMDHTSWNFWASPVNADVPFACHDHWHFDATDLLH